MYGRDAADHPMLQKASQACLKAGGEVIEVNREILEKVSRRDNPQAVVGVFEQVYTPLSAIVPQSAPCWVAMQAVRDPGNLGTVIRTADAAGCGGVILVGDCVDPYSVEGVRATMGSIFAVKIAKASMAEFLAWREDLARLGGRHPADRHGRPQERRLCEAVADPDGQRAAGPAAGTGRRLRRQRQDPDARPGRQPEPVGGDGIMIYTVTASAIAARRRLAITLALSAVAPSAGAQDEPVPIDSIDPADASPAIGSDPYRYQLTLRDGRSPLHRTRRGAVLDRQGRAWRRCPGPQNR
jgi:hypothetical protein